MSAQSILYPVFALVGLTVFVLVRLATIRLRAISGGSMNLEFYRLFQGREEPNRLRATTRNFVNLTELPILFYVVCILAYVTSQTTPLVVGLAWLFVGTRYVHSFVHLTSNEVPRRFFAYVAGLATLVALWVVLGVQLMLSG